MWLSVATGSEACLSTMLVLHEFFDHTAMLKLYMDLYMVSSVRHSLLYSIDF